MRLGMTAGENPGRGCGPHLEMPFCSEKFDMLNNTGRGTSFATCPRHQELLEKGRHLLQSSLALCPVILFPCSGCQGRHGCYD